MLLYTSLQKERDSYSQQVLSAQTQHALLAPYLAHLNTFAGMANPKADAATFTAFRTFEAFFGQVFFGAFNNANVGGNARVQFVTGRSMIQHDENM